MSADEANQQESQLPGFLVADGIGRIRLWLKDLVEMIKTLDFQIQNMNRNMICTEAQLRQISDDGAIVAREGMEQYVGQLTDLRDRLVRFRQECLQFMTYADKLGGNLQ